MATQGKWAREQAQQERRARKRAKKADAAAQRSAGNTPADGRDAHPESAGAVR